MCMACTSVDMKLLTCVVDLIASYAYENQSRYTGAMGEPHLFANLMQCASLHALQ